MCSILKDNNIFIKAFWFLVCYCAWFGFDFLLACNLDGIRFMML